MTPRVYTKLGDDGSTGLLFGGRVSKSADVIAVVGALDEAVAALGMARAALPHRELREQVLQVQRGLFVVGADVAANPHARDQLVPRVSLVDAAMVTDVEELIDVLVGREPLRPVFVVPGETLGGAAVDVGRTLVRRAERILVGLSDDHERDPDLDRWTLAYLNRVSDLLYVMGRRANEGLDEPPSHASADDPAS